MSKSLTDLCSCIYPKIAELLRKANADLGFSMVIVGTGRTPDEQEINLRLGVSWTKRSKHLPQPGCGKSHAADVAPYHLTQLKNWAPNHPDWQRLGELGELLGLSWGGRWKHQRDCPHFEVAVNHSIPPGGEHERANLHTGPGIHARPA